MFLITRIDRCRTNRTPQRPKCVRCLVNGLDCIYEKKGRQRSCWACIARKTACKPSTASERRAHVDAFDVPDPAEFGSYSAATISGAVQSRHLEPGHAVVDLQTGSMVSEVDDLHAFGVVLGPHEGLALLVAEAV